jgi:membrane protease YdiL (CAAX protease family)
VKSFRLRGWLGKHPVLSYLVLAYAITWISLLAAIVAIQFDWVTPDSPILEVANNLGTFGPAIAAFVIAAAIGGKREVGQLLRRMAHWRVGIGWYLFVLVAVPLILVLGMSVVYGPALLGVLIAQWPLFFTGFLPAVAITTIITGLGEEPGWRGFALPRLQAKYGVLLGILILNVVWQLWHLPNILFQPGGLGAFALWTLATVANGFILAWVYNSTGSLLLVMLLHAAQNKSTGLVSNLVYLLDPTILEQQAQFTNQIYVVSAAAVGVVVLLLIVLTRGRLGYKADPAAGRD